MKRLTAAQKADRNRNFVGYVVVDMRTKRTLSRHRTAKAATASKRKFTAAGSDVSVFRTVKASKPSVRNPAKKAKRGAPLREGQRVYHCSRKCRNPSGKTYEVYAGGVGIVYEGTSLAKAKAVYAEHVADSKAGRGAVAGESVALMLDGDPIKDYQGRNDRATDDDSYTNPDHAMKTCSRCMGMGTVNTHPKRTIGGRRETVIRIVNCPKCGGRGETPVTKRKARR